MKKYETYIASFCAVQSPTICMLPLTGISFNIVDFYVPVFAKNAKCGMLEQLNPQVWIFKIFREIEQKESFSQLCFSAL